jgi:hypothetical protein
MLEILGALAAISLGIFAGAQLAEACVLVPFWRRLSATEFFSLHHAMGPILFRFFAPVTAVAVLLALASAFFTPDNLWSVSGAALSLMALVMFFAYFKSANAAFAERSITDEELHGELARWAKWHLVRTTIVIGAFTSSIIAL